ncbi:MAG TPA: dihydrodipicolinate synthase family protein [bacterium]|nr:dihydrodipicolinate synthase family protein [bacterium]
MDKKKIDLKGVLAPIPTPFEENGILNLNRLDEITAFLSKCGLTGIVVMGSSGEAVHLNFKEKCRLLDRAAGLAPPEWTLVAGTGCFSTIESLELTREAARAGFHAALIITPFYYRSRMAAEVLTAYYRDLADSSPIPIVIYNMPANTGINLSAEILLDLAIHPNIIGLKDSGGNMGVIARLKNEPDGNFDILAGSASFFLPALCVGASGGIMALANIAPVSCVTLYDSFRAGDLEKARKIQQRLSELNAAVTSRWGVAGLKAAMEIRGLHTGPPRRPLLPAGPDIHAVLTDLMEKSLLPEDKVRRLS